MFLNNIEVLIHIDRYKPPNWSLMRVFMV